MASRARQNELLQLQSEVTNEISRDAPAIARTVFGDNADHPDMARVQNDRLDQIYRDAFVREDREWLQSEARRDPEQFLKVAERIGVQKPPPPAASPGAVAGAPAALPPSALPAAPVMPMAPPAVAPVPPVTLPPTPLVAPSAPAPVILGPNGQPLPPSGL